MNSGVKPGFHSEGTAGGGGGADFIDSGVPKDRNGFSSAMTGGPGRKDFDIGSAITDVSKPICEKLFTGSMRSVVLTSGLDDAGLYTNRETITCVGLSWGDTKGGLTYFFLRL